MRLLLLLAWPLVALGSLTNIYYGQASAGSNNGTSCANQYAVADGTNGFSVISKWGSGSTQIGPDTIAHVCGTLTASAGTNGYLVFQGSGTSGHPITLLWEAGAIVQAPYFVVGINLNGQSFVTLDGGSNGIVKNSDNGDALGNKKNTQLIAGGNCTNCTVKNLEIGPAFVHIKNTPENGSGYDHQLIQATTMNGSNWTWDHNTIHDCGWCINFAYGVGETNFVFTFNNVYNMDHGLAIYDGNSSAGTLSTVLIHDNRLHDTGIWDCGSTGGVPDCHHDPIHIFAGSGDTNSITGLYVSNNYFYGSMGCCTTGQIYVEGGVSPAHVITSFWWNNVFEVHSDNEANTGGWVLMASSSTLATFVNNSIIAEGYNDLSACMGLGTATTPSIFKNNMLNYCGQMTHFESVTGSASDINFNYYGQSCFPMQTFNNCFDFNGSFLNSFTSWKSSSGWDANSLSAQNGSVYFSNSTLFNSNGSPQTSSPVIGAGANLTSLATGSMASLASDTTLGGTRTALARPSSGAWDIGALQFSAGTSGGGSSSLGASAVLGAGVLHLVEAGVLH